MRVHPFCPYGGLLKGSGFPPGSLGFAGVFHHATLLYYGCQVSEVYAMAVDSVEDSFVRAIIAEY